MITRLECSDKLRPNVALTVVERDEAGGMVGFWRGYWNPNREAVELYPAYNPSCVWRVPRRKHTVSDRSVEWLWKAPVAPAPVEEMPKAVKRRYSPFPGKDAKPSRIEGQLQMEVAVKSEE